MDTDAIPYDNLGFVEKFLVFSELISRRPRAHFPFFK